MSHLMACKKLVNLLETYVNCDPKKHSPNIHELTKYTWFCGKKEIFKVFYGFNNSIKDQC